MTLFDPAVTSFVPSGVYVRKVGPFGSWVNISHENHRKLVNWAYELVFLVPVAASLLECLTELAHPQRHRVILQTRRNDAKRLAYVIPLYRREGAPRFTRSRLRLVIPLFFINKLLVVLKAIDCSNSFISNMEGQQSTNITQGGAVTDPTQSVIEKGKGKATDAPQDVSMGEDEDDTSDEETGAEEDVSNYPCHYFEAINNG